MSKFIQVDGKSASNKVRRDAVQLGQVFALETNGKTKLIAHTGERTTPPSKGIPGTKAWQGMNLVSGEPTVSHHGETMVEIVGTYTLNVSLADVYKAKYSRMLGA